MKNNIISIILVIIVSGMLLSGCTKTVYGLSDGTYIMQGAQDEPLQPAITFNVEEETFIFKYDILSSYFPHGSWALHDEKLVAKTDDNKYTYIFEVVDNDTIRFVQENSSQITAIKGDTPVVDGAEFKFKDQQKNS